MHGLVRGGDSKNVQIIDTAMGNYGLAHDNLPSLNTSLTYKFPGGHDVLTAAMLRKLSVEKAKEAASDESEPGWAVRGAANIKPSDIVTQKTLAIHGDGAGNDLAGTGARLPMSWKQGKKHGKTERLCPRLKQNRYHRRFRSGYRCRFRSVRRRLHEYRLGLGKTR